MSTDDETHLKNKELHDISKRKSGDVVCKWIFKDIFTIDFKVKKIIYSNLMKFIRWHYACIYKNDNWYSRDYNDKPSW